VINRILDTGIIENIDLIVAETHERMTDALRISTDQLRVRIAAMGLEQKISLDWT
jgi:hypothetical protein